MAAAVSLVGGSVDGDAEVFESESGRSQKRLVMQKMNERNGDENRSSPEHRKSFLLGVPRKPPSKRCSVPGLACGDDHLVLAIGWLSGLGPRWQCRVAPVIFRDARRLAYLLRKRGIYSSMLEIWMGFIRERRGHKGFSQGTLNGPPQQQHVWCLLRLGSMGGRHRKTW